MTILRACLALPLFALFAACSSTSTTGNPNGNGTDAGGGDGSGGEGGSCAFPCQVPAPSTPSFVTDYCCLDQSAVNSCPKNVVPCAPTNKARGKVALGFSCSTITVTPAAAAGNELGDDCAPIAKYASAKAPKGTYCLNQIASGRTYCSHDCTSDMDCADLQSKALCPIAQGETIGQCTLPAQ